jgi:glycosyltransferase involved in cell wall biosynthesis
VAPVYSPSPDNSGDGESARLLGPSSDVTELLNVGSTAPRKRIDFLLRLFAAVRDKYPNLRLIRVGGGLTRAQGELARSLGVRQAIVELPFLPSRTLAAIYRRAAVALCPSELEGFGLPLLESMACGTPVVASDLAVLREVGASAPQYAAVGDVDQWTTAVLDLLGDRGSRGWAARRWAGVERAKNFPWWKTAARTVALYRNLLS